MFTRHQLYLFFTCRVDEKCGSSDIIPLKLFNNIFHRLCNICMTAKSTRNQEEKWKFTVWKLKRSSVQAQAIIQIL